MHSSTFDKESMSSFDIWIIDLVSSLVIYVAKILF